MIRLAAVVLVAACSSPAGRSAAPPSPPPQPPPTTAPETSPPAPVVAPTAKTNERYTVVARGGRKSGSFTRTIAGNDISFVFHVLQNGRGPHTEGSIKLAGDQTPVAFAATGHHEMGTKVAETFARKGDRAAWKSEEEQGDAPVKGAAFFLPIADVPMSDLIVVAARKTGGSIPLLPGGEARVSAVGDLEVTKGADKQALVGYAITGIGLRPIYTWFDKSGHWFGEFNSWQSIVREGWEDVVDPVLDRQRDLDAAADAKLAKETRHVPPAEGLALTHATVLDVQKGKWLADQTIVVVGDTIKAVGAKAKVPKGAEVVDLAGKHVIPGLIDMHSHTGPEDAVLDIASGVTTVRDVGNEPDRLDDMLERFDDGGAVGPSIVRMGFIEGRNEKAAASRVTAETVDEAKAAVEFFAKRHYEGIKIYNSVKTELVPVLTKEAHARGMLVTGHVPVHMLANEAVKAGYDGIEHINQMMLNFFATHDTDTRDTTRFSLVGEKMGDFDIDGKAMKDFFALLRQKHTVLDPTLDAFEDLYAGVPGQITPGLEDTVARLPLQVQRSFKLGGLPLDGDKRARYLKAWEKMLAVIKAMWKAKLHLVAGTDHIGGVMLHHELALFVRAGIPPADVLRIATLDAARGMKLDKKLGSITAGKRADLAIVDGDPVADIAQIRKVERTLRAGVLYTSAPLYASVGVQP